VKTFAIVLSLVASGFGASVQSRPDLTGTWISDPVKNAPMVEKGFSAIFEKQTITVSETAMTFTSWAGPSPEEVAQRNSPGQTIVCNFGSTPADNALPMHHVMCSAKWDGSSLVLIQTVPPFGATKGRVVTANLSLEDRQLKIASTWVGEKRFESLTYWSKSK
jgi:hypothetical protein